MKMVWVRDFVEAVAIQCRAMLLLWKLPVLGFQFKPDITWLLAAEVAATVCPVSVFTCCVHLFIM